MQVLPGNPLLLGATLHDDSVNFAVFSRHAHRVWLLLFDSADTVIPSHEIELDPKQNRTADIWHIEIKGLQAGQLYLYRVDGVYNPYLGHRFDHTQGLIDPYAKALAGTYSSNRSTSKYRPDWRASNFHFLPKGVVIDESFDWQGDRPLNRPLNKTVIYETHVRGLTQHKSSGVDKPGTYAGAIEKIPYFKELGVTAIEFLPIHTADTGMYGRINPITGDILTNYWGYQTVNFFSPAYRYAHNKDWHGQINEFKMMVREFHKAGLEVILDVVYNHTAEGNHKGTYLSFRGFDNTIYYLLADDKQYYMNYSGTGNTFNCNHPVVRDLIMDSLRYWVVKCHVDGFRFDLASILGRDQHGNLLANPPLIEQIAEDPILRNTKIIAEAWDAAGAYQVGSFPNRRWSELNGRYRDDIRQFWRGDFGMISAFATRLTGSSDLYLRDGRAPFHSINFITSHDGFTLNDLVSYNYKHNLANGENNRDGDNHNISDNLGWEGPTFDPIIEHRRNRRLKNFLTTLMLSQGVPMILGGDEFRRTQKGNNNSYAQDNDISWYDWSLKEKNSEMFNFAKQIIRLRKAHPIFHRQHFFTGFDGDHFDIQWFSPSCGEADWGHHSRALMCLIYGNQELDEENRADNDALLLINADFADHEFTLPVPLYGREWRRVVDTNLAPPQDIRSVGKEEKLENQQHYSVSRQSIVVMISFRKNRS